MEFDKKYPIGVVQRQTGLSTHVIRKWEERYQAIVPIRDNNGRRFYSSDDIKRLQLLKQVIATGRSIGQIVHTPHETLKTYLESDRDELHIKEYNKDEVEEICEQFLLSCKKYQDGAMKEILEQSYVTYGLHSMTSLVIPHIMHTVGRAWHSGEIRIVQEHMATFRITSFLMRVFDEIKLPQTAVFAISATLHDQHHTVASLIAAITSRDAGYNTLYMGGNIPPSEISLAVIENNAKLLMLSFNYPYNKLQIASDMSLIKNSVPEDVHIVIGGASAALYKKHNSDTRCYYSENFFQLRKLIDTFTSSAMDK